MIKFKEFIFELKFKDLEKQKEELKNKIEKANGDEKQNILLKITSIDDRLRILANS